MLFLSYSSLQSKPSLEVSSLSPCIWAEGQQCLIAQAKDSEVILIPPSHNPVLSAILVLATI